MFGEDRERVREGILEEPIFNLDSEDEEKFAEESWVWGEEEARARRSFIKHHCTQGAVVLTFVGSQRPVSYSSRDKIKGGSCINK